MHSINRFAHHFFFHIIMIMTSQPIPWVGWIDSFNATTGSLKTLDPCGVIGQKAQSSCVGRASVRWFRKRRIHVTQQGRDNTHLRLNDDSMHSLYQTQQPTTRERWNHIIQLVSLKHKWYRRSGENISSAVFENRWMNHNAGSQCITAAWFIKVSIEMQN